MKKVINGKTYDTTTATLIGSTSYGCPGDLDYWAEQLFRKRTGEFFLHGVGGPASRYSRKTGQNQWSGGAAIRPLSLTDAQDWAERYLDAADYDRVFGCAAE